MPIYEYQCASCDNKTEQLQKVSDARLTICPACGEPALNKLVSAVAFRLKGGGWYETDFKTGSKKNVAGAAGDDAAAGDGAAAGGDAASGDGAASGDSVSGSGGAGSATGDAPASAAAG